MGYSPNLAEQLNQLPEIEAATGIRIGAARDIDGGGDTAYISVDPETASTIFDIGMIQGTVESLTPDGILIDDDEAADRHLGLGDQIKFGFVNGSTHLLTIQGIYTEQDLAGPFVVHHALHEQSGADQFDFSVYVARLPASPTPTPEQRSRPSATNIRTPTCRAAASTSMPKRPRSTHWSTSCTRCSDWL